MNEKIALALGVSKDATDEQLLGAITQLKEQLGQAQAHLRRQVELRIDCALYAGAIRPDQRPVLPEVGRLLGLEALDTLLLPDPLAETDDEHHPPSPLDGVHAS